MQPTFVSKHVVLDFSNPLQRDSNKRKQQQQPPTPESNTKRPRQKSPFGLSWERDPHDPYKFLEPPGSIAKNQMFSVEFRLMFDNEEERVYLIAYFYAQLQPDNKPEYPLACERVKTGRLHRVPLYLANAGIYTLEIVIVPDNKSYRPAVYRHEKNITVVESDYENVHVGPHEHRRLIGFDRPKRVGQGISGADVDCSKSTVDEHNNTKEHDSYGNGANEIGLGTDGHYPASSQEGSLEVVDNVKYLTENTEDYIMQWLNLNFQPAEEDAPFSLEK
ncbi:hypothetical protein UA08_05438 [Talaromyces atroroseus]|uniref:Uncharacterized protein n=1 Tax=Talaromyces atroroseus TaxID=1441469 RepID=A0A225AED1_TALAT|nr:hypothetical protein UA08_05438 [Talaromyces atroroseus]OKL59622.1 hypothetical protein UA08_05438 [Talaromyces atroroseus]